MWKQISLLNRLQFINFWGLNQIRYGKDPRQKNRLYLMLGAYLVLGAVIGFYSGMIGFGCVSLGMGRVIPAYVLSVVSIAIFFFTVFKAGSILFDLRSYEILSALPVRPAAIVVSRFATLYVQDTALGLVMLLPAAAVYAVMERPDAWFYLAMVLGAGLLPLLPITVAVAVGALVTAISSRMKYKNLVSILLSMTAVIALMVMINGGLYAVPEEELSILSLQKFVDMMEQMIYSIYPPAELFAKGVHGDIAAFLLFAAVSVLPAAALVVLIQGRFGYVCSLLNAKATQGHYRLEKQTSRRPLTALYLREMKRYFSSSIYVMNTLIGYIMMVLLGVGVLSMGTEQIDQVLGMPGMTGKVLPFVMAALCGMSSTTTSAVSMEGKSWWLVRSLPVTAARLFDAKMLVNLSVALPCYAVTEAMLLAAVKPSFVDGLFLLLLPLAYILFMTVFGITVNCKLPLMEWESEAAVVKQSGALLVSMMTGFVISLAPLAALFLLPQVSPALVSGAVLVLLLTAAMLLYRRNQRIDLRTIE